MTRRLPKLPGQADVLEVECWCRERVLRVDRLLVLKGQTLSCGKKECRE